MTNKTKYLKIIRESMHELNQVCLKHTGLTYRRIYNWQKRWDPDFENYYLTNPIDAEEFLWGLQWRDINKDFCPPLSRWDDTEFQSDIKIALQPGKEAMWRYVDLQLLETA